MFLSLLILCSSRTVYSCITQTMKNLEHLPLLFLWLNHFITSRFKLAFTPCMQHVRCRLLFVMDRMTGCPLSGESWGKVYLDSWNLTKHSKIQKLERKCKHNTWFTIQYNIDYNLHCISHMSTVAQAIERDVLLLKHWWFESRVLQMKKAIVSLGKTRHTSPLCEFGVCGRSEGPMAQINSRASVRLLQGSCGYISCLPWVVNCS